MRIKFYNLPNANTHSHTHTQTRLRTLSERARQLLATCALNRISSHLNEPASRLRVAANFNNDSILIRMLDCIRRVFAGILRTGSPLNGGLMQSPKRLPLSALLRSHSASNCLKGLNANYCREWSREGSANRWGKGIGSSLLIGWQAAKQLHWE